MSRHQSADCTQDHHGAGLGNFRLVNQTGVAGSRLDAVYDDVAGVLTVRLHMPFSVIWLW